MALLWFDGMDRYGISSALQRAYPWNSSTYQFETGRYGGQALMLPKTFDSNTFTPPTFETSTTIVVGFGLKVGGLSRTPILTLNDVSHSNAYTLYINSNGQLEFWVGNTLFTYASKAIAPNVWYHIELRLKIGGNGAGGGELRLRVDEVMYMEVGDGTNYTLGVDNTGGGLYTGINSIRFSTQDTNATDLYLDDIFIMNQRGNINNSLSGDAVVESFVPTGGTTLAYSAYPQGSQTWQVVSEVPPNDDTSYAYTAEHDGFDRYTSNQPQYIRKELFGFKVSALARKDTSQFASLIPFYNKSGVGTYEGPQTALTTGYQYCTMMAGYQGEWTALNGTQGPQGPQGPQTRFAVSAIQGFNFGAKRRDNNA